MSRKLPVMETFGKALSLVWERRAFVLAISWPYLIASAIVIGIGLSLALEQPLPQPDGEASDPDVFEAVLSLVQGFFLAILAVYWHRNILLREEQAPALPLRFDAYVWRYIGYLLLLALVSIAVITLGSMLAAALVVGAGIGAALIGALVIPFVVLALVVMFRASLVLPAAAVGDRDMSLRRSWRLTRGNTWRLLGLQLLLLAIPLGLSVLAALIGMSLGDTQVSLWLQVAADTVIGWVFTLVGLAILSLLYAWFMHNAPPVDAELKA